MCMIRQHVFVGPEPNLLLTGRLVIVITIVSWNYVSHLPMFIEMVQPSKLVFVFLPLLLQFFVDFLPYKYLVPCVTVSSCGIFSNPSIQKVIWD